MKAEQGQGGNFLCSRPAALGRAEASPCLREGLCPTPSQSRQRAVTQSCRDEQKLPSRDRRLGSLPADCSLSKGLLMCLCHRETVEVVLVEVSGDREGQ